jgi:hypothetical protein
VTSWTIGHVRASGEAYLREVGHARVLGLRGRATASPAEIRERYAYELGRDALDVVLEQADLAGPDTPDARSGRALLAWLTGLEVTKVCAPLDEWITRWKSSAVVRTADARAIPFGEVDGVIAHERSRAARLHVDAARTELADRDLLPTMRERAARERDTIESMGIGDSMLEVASRLSGVDGVALEGLARDALARSADAWRDSLGERLHRQSAITFQEAQPADLAAAISLAELDGAFPPSLRSLTVRRMIAGMGLDPDAGGRLHIGASLIAGAPPVETIPVDVPRDVHIMLGADGGFEGYRRALRALGRALRLVHVREDVEFEHRWLGERGANEIGGLTLGLVLLDGDWLMRYASLTRAEAENAVRRAALASMYELRHALATLRFHVHSVDAGLSAGAVQELYVETMGSAIGVRPHAADAVLAAPRLLHPFSRVQAWQGASVLADSLVEQFDVDWYRNPRSGPWLVNGVLGPACGEVAAEVIKGATGRELSLAPYLTRLEQLLSA